MKVQILNAADAYINANKLGKIVGLKLFSERYNQGLIEDVLECKSVIPSVSRNSLIRWQKTVAEKGIAGLALKPKRTGKSIIDSDKELADFCIAMIYEYPHVKATQIKEGLIARFYQVGKSLPAETTIRDWLTRWKRENSALYTKMANPDAWKNKYMSAMGKMDENVKRLNQLWEFDSTPSDVMLTDGRHSLIGIIDVFSRRAKVVIHPTSDSTGICLVIRKAILDWGIPEIARTDNGKDYTSIQIKSVFDALDIKHETTRPFSGEEKPYIERFFKIVIPLCKAPVVVAFGLSFAHTIGEFGVVLMIGGSIPGETQVLSIALYEQVEALAYDQAHVLSLLLLVFSFILLAALYRFNGIAVSRSVNRS